MNTRKILFCISLSYFLMISNMSIAGVDLPWSSTYNCSEWVYGQSLNCNGLEPAGGWSCNGTYEQITSNANFPGGGGGKGQRHWKGDGSNVNSGGLYLLFNTPQPEFWVRWYMRYQSGFKWMGDDLSYDKILYIRPAHGPVADVIINFVWGLHQMRIYTGGGGDFPETKIFGWQDIMGGTASDGLFHCYEVHLKMDTNGTDGQGDWWIDGVLRISKADVNYSYGDEVNRQGWTSIMFGSNQATPNNGSCMYVDYDDVAISKTGYIGPIGNKPTPPTGLKIVK